MNREERIYIAPKRGRLPRRYEVIDDRSPEERWRRVQRVLVWRRLAWILLAGALVTGLILWRMSGKVLS